MKKWNEERFREEWIKKSKRQRVKDVKERMRKWYGADLGKDNFDGQSYLTASL